MESEDEDCAGADETKVKACMEMLEKMSEEPIQEKRAEEGKLTKKGAIIAMMKSKYVSKT